jgi:predicted metal-dependent HD superfamily phosphohydrolase
MLTDELKTLWNQLHQPITTDRQFTDETFADLVQAYEGKGRHYHTLQHIQAMFNSLQEYASLLRETDVVAFSIFFHDYVYNASSKTNEEESAEAAVQHLEKTGFPAEKTARVKAYIIATKTHVNAEQQPDLDYLLDFDLQILGAEPAIYEAYTRQIRQEYIQYPDLLYKPGRKKVLQHFLQMPAIYKTAEFRARYEAAARKNIETEITNL